MSIDDFLSLNPTALETLESIDFSEPYHLELNELNDLEDGQFEELCKRLELCEKLKHLNLKGAYLYNLKPQRFERFCQAIAKCRGIQDLDLSENYFSRTQFPFLCNTLSQLTKLKRINLSRNELSKLTLVQFQNFINTLAACNTLEEMDFSNLNFFNVKHYEKFQYFCNSLKLFKNLKTIDLSINEFKYKPVEIQNLFNAITECKTLQTLLLRGINLHLLDKN